MYFDDATSSLPILYRGASVGKVSVYTDNDFSKLLDVPKLTRQLLFAVTQELTRNATKYGQISGTPSEMIVDQDDDGFFVEVTSVGSHENAMVLQRLIDRHKSDSDEELFDAEHETLQRNKGTGASGIGVLQMLRRAKRCGEERMVSLGIEELSFGVRVTVRVYVA